VDTANILLSDGSPVHLRQIRPDDAPAMLELHSRMSARTRYLRFFSPYPRVPRRHLERFVNVDHHDREALVVLSGPRLMAVGRYERIAPGSPDAEVALVVEDAYQHRGIGSTLLEHLVEAARENGIRCFVGSVLLWNDPMLRMISCFGGQLWYRYADGTVHVGFSIAPTRGQRSMTRSSASEDPH
jgi:GNAT superfamily N-acetyltransferase